MNLDSFNKVCDEIITDVNNIWKQYRNIKYKLGFTLPKFLTLEGRDKYYREWCDVIKIPEEYKEIWEQYKYIEKTPQPEQRTPLWYEMRNSFITASAGAQALGESKYNCPEELILKKIDKGIEFEENYNVFHGKKLEDIATLIYEQIYNVKVGQFGLVADISKKAVSYIGASPDGICTCSTLDGYFSSLVGRMLEIKCVTTRIINPKGEIDGVIVPHDYYVQMMLQLHCCDLEYCDFWQCKIKDTFNDVKHLYNYKRKFPSVHYRNQGDIYTINENLEIGTFIQLAPKKVELKGDEKAEYFSKFIYPTNINVSMDEKIKWAKNMELNWEKYFPELAKNYTFDCIKYYYLELSHCLTVKRDDEWFEENKKKFKEFWDRVLKSRNDENAEKELKEKCELFEKKKKQMIYEKRKEKEREKRIIMEKLHEDFY